VGYTKGWEGFKGIHKWEIGSDVYFDFLFGVRLLSITLCCDLRSCMWRGVDTWVWNCKGT
jgi:hypothetical protein